MLSPKVPGMGKRTTFADETDFDETPSKRQKLSDSAGAVAKSAEEINSVEQLRTLLAFDQAGGFSVRQNIQSFKRFLEAITYGETGTDRSNKQGLLLDFLKSETSDADDTTSICLEDLMQTWSFATQSNNDGLLSAIPAVLALLLKTISNLIDFREFGTQLCKTLMRKDQIRLFDRGLTANKTKEFLISPCIRLLTEVVSFDGGSSAKRLYLQRDVTFKRLDIFLNMRKKSQDIAPEDPRKPSVRQNALRYILANLRLQDQNAKGDILSQPKLIRAIFQDIRDDSANMIHEILSTVKKSVALDATLSRTVKSKVFTDWTLTRIAGLYGFEEDETLLDGRPAVQDSAHAFLLFICTTIDHGVLVAQCGWYPPGTDVPSSDLDTEKTPLGVDQWTWHDKYTEKVPVRNTTLASFIQGLRPYASTSQRELLIAVFQFAPELVADYFFKKKSFSFDPKLSATWIGYSVFLFSVAQLHIPDRNLSDIPPPVSIVIESILPQPLTQKALTRCLNQNTSFIAFLAARLLIVSFSKLESVLLSFHPKERSKTVWGQARVRLKAEFCKRSPELKHIIAAFRSCPKDSVMLREALLRLLAMYYKYIPQVALEEKFDISIALSQTLHDIELTKEDLENKAVSLMELDHLLEIAHRSPDMQWWQKPENMPLSPFTTVLRLHVNAAKDAQGNIQKLLQSVVEDHAMLQHDTKIPSFNALVASLKANGEWQATSSLYVFLDNCILRLVRKTIKYYGDVKELTDSVLFKTTNDQRKPTSLLLMVILEQWPFFVEATPASELANATFWIARYLEYLQCIGEDIAILQNVRDRLRDRIKDKHCRSMLKATLKNEANADSAALLQGQLHDVESLISNSSGLEGHPEVPSSNTARPNLDLVYGPPGEADDHPELSRWIKQDISDAIEDGTIGKLLLCLCSKHEEIRKQALVAIRNLMAKLEGSGYNEWQQVYILLGEAVESAREVISTEPYPFFAGVIASRSLSVLADPLHFMYTKVNRFLNKSPNWNVAKLPSYWADKVFLHPPVNDDTHHKEVRWLVDALIDGLRTPADMNQYRRCKIFERLLSLLASPSLQLRISDRIVHLLYRCTYVDGSTTLLTRCAVLSWIKACTAKGGMDEVMLLSLASRISKTCDKDRIREWSNGIASV